MLPCAQPTHPPTHPFTSAAPLPARPLPQVPAEVKQLYGLMESDFNPLQLCKVVAPLLESLQGLNQAVSGAHCACCAVEWEGTGCGLAWLRAVLFGREGAALWDA